MSGILQVKPAFFVKFVILSILALAITIVACDGKSTENEDPVISNLIAPDSLIKNLPDVYLIYLTASDPQGLDDLDSVFFTVERPDGTSNGVTFYMFDDGENGGDPVAGDGIYVQGIQSPTDQNQTGDYKFYFQARDTDGNLSNTIEKTITAYEYDNPVISYISANQYDPDRRFLYVAARVVDAQGHIDIERVWADITCLDQDTLIGSFDLNDFGNDGDSTALDDFYSLNITASLDTIYQAGSYLIEFNAVDYEGNQAVPADTTIVVDPPT